MGPICPPSYVNTLMSHFEWKYIYPDVIIDGKSLTYFTYIRDIFLIWTGTKKELDQFFKDLNKKHTCIKFDYKALKNCIAFLDTKTNLHKAKLLCIKPNYTQRCREKKLVDSTTTTWNLNSLPRSQPIQIKRIGPNQGNEKQLFCWIIFIIFAASFSSNPSFSIIDFELAPIAPTISGINKNLYSACYL